MAELKLCPFCGGEATVNYDPDGVCDTYGRHLAYTVVCNKCCATSGLTYSRERAIEAWNKRTERPKGRWVLNKKWYSGKWHKWYECSCCGERDDNHEMYEAMPFAGGLSNYCPNCGADMRGESE